MNAAQAALLGMTAGALSRLAQDQPIMNNVHVNMADGTVHVDFNGTHYVLSIKEEE